MIKVNDFCFPRLIKNNRLDIGSLNLLNLPNLATRLTHNPWAAKESADDLTTLTNICWSLVMSIVKFCLSLRIKRPV